MSETARRFVSNRPLDWKPIQLPAGMIVFARLMNLTDQRYADSASVSSSTAVFSPALPRALYVGLDAIW